MKAARPANVELQLTFMHATPTHCSFGGDNWFCDFAAMPGRVVLSVPGGGGGCVMGTYWVQVLILQVRNAFSAARRPHPAVPRGREFCALEVSNSLIYRAFGLPSRTLGRIPGKALRAFPGSLRNFSGRKFFSGWHLCRTKTDPKSF